MEKIRIIKPNDAHLHVRDGEYLATTVPHAAERFSRAIIMPNLKPPVANVEQAKAYRQRILAALPPGSAFHPCMTLYLTETLSPAMIQAAAQTDFISGVKLYPAGVTTHSEAGVQSLEKIYPVLEAMQAADLPLLIHGESNRPDVDIFDRERYFLEDLSAIRKRFPQLRMVLEHITTKDAVQFVLNQPAKIFAATITAHHLLLNRNDLLVGGIHPHYYCLPILKRRQHQEALLRAATSGDPHFFLGTDSAPHAQHLKETACGCAGIYTEHAAIELYAEIFASQNALDKLENFASVFAADFYRWPRNEARITLVKESWQVPKQFDFGKDKLVPFRAGENISWSIKE